MAVPPSARWRPPSSRRSLTYYRWSAWMRLAVAALVGAMAVAGLVRGTSNVVGCVLFLFVAAFAGSTGIWMLQGIHSISRELQEASPPSDD